MRGLERIPGLPELQGAYAAFQGGSASPLSAEHLALTSQWSRFDPRLAEQWIQYVSGHWRNIASGRLGLELQRLPWPASAGVLLEQGAELLVARAERTPFRAWARSVMAGIPPAGGELFFIGTRAFAGRQSRLDAERPLKSYRRWGYLGRDLLINKAETRTRKPTLLDRNLRLRVLAELVRQRPRLRVQDYVDALEGRISARQAQLDLARHPKLRPVGATRGRFYVRLK